MTTAPQDGTHIVSIPQHKDAATAAGNVGDRTVRTYDFRRPQHLSADQVRGVQSVHIAAAANIRRQLARYLNADLDLRMEKAEELAYGLLIDGLPQHTYANILDLSPLVDKGVLLIDGPLCLAFVDRVLGGRGKTPSEPRALTAVDEVAVESAVQIVLGCLREAWNDFCPIKLSVTERRCDARQAQILGPSEAVLTITFAASGDLGEGEIKLCLPIASLKAAIDGASQRALGLNVDPESIPMLRAAIVRSLGKVTLPLTACVGTADVPIRSLLNLGDSDILRLDKLTGTPVVLEIAGRPTFTARMGLQGRKKAVQVLERVETE